MLAAMNTNQFQTCRFRILILLLFLTPLFYIEPWIFRIDMADAFTIPKRYLTQISALALTISYIGELLVYKKIRIRWCRYTWAFAFFLLWALASLSYSPSFHAGFREIIRWSCYAVIFLSATNELHTTAQMESVIFAAIASATVASLFALAQFFGCDPSFLKGGTQKIYSTIGNPNHLASYLAIALPPACCGWLSPFPGRKKSALLFSCSIIGTAALLITGARGGWAAFCGGTIVSMAILRWPIPRFRLPVLIITLAVLVVLFALPSPINRYDTGTLKKFSELTGIIKSIFLPEAPRTPASRSGNAAEGQSPAEGPERSPAEGPEQSREKPVEGQSRGKPAEGSLPQGGSAWRMMVWSIGLQMGKEHPLRGSGIGSFNLLYLDHLAEFLSAPENKRYISLAEGGIDYVHNDYLQVWIEFGLIGLAPFIVFLTSLMVNGFSGAKQTAGEGNWITGALLAGCVAFLLEGTVSFPFYLWSSAVTFFTFAGMVASAASRERTIYLERLPFARAAGLLLFVAVLLSPVCIWYMCGTVVSEVHLSRGIALFYGGDSARAFNEFDRATQWQPHNGQARFFLALCLAEKTRYTEALRELLSASHTFSRQATYVQLGRIYGRLGNVDAGRQFLDKAISILPRDPDAWLEKGNLLYTSGNIRGASTCFHTSVSLRPDYFPAARNLAVSLDALGQTNDALRAYERALELKPHEADLYVNMGALCARTGDAQRAQALWQKALSIDPTNEMAKENLRRLERSNKNKH